MLLAFQILWERLHLRLKLVWSILLYGSFKKGFIWNWIWFDAPCFPDPSRKASFEAESGLKLFLIQILKEKHYLRLELVWSIFLHRSFKKGVIWGWIWFEASCYTDPLRKASFDADAGLKHLASQILQERLHLRMDLVWSFFLYRSLKKRCTWGLSWVEASCLTTP